MSHYKFAVCGLLCCLMALASAAQGAESYSRGILWNSSSSNPQKGSDTEANTASNVWTYEQVVSTGVDNGLSGANPWYQLDASGAVAWNATDLRWDGASGTYPRFQSTSLTARLAAGGYGHQPRVAWKAPAAGTVSFSGSFGFGTSDNSARTVEWAFAKRVGSTYTPLASGSFNTPTVEPTYQTGSMGASVGSALTSAGRPIELRYPMLSGAPVTNRKFPVVVVGHGSALTGVNSAQLYSHMVPKGFVIIAPTFSGGSSTWAADVTNILNDMLTRTDLPIQLDPDRVGYSGTSMGGITGLTKFRIDRYDPRIKAMYVRAASTSSGSSSYDWTVGTPLLMLHGTADMTVPYSSGHNNYLVDAKSPKGFISLAGVGHNMAFSASYPGNFYNDIPESFFGYFLKGNTNGLNAVATACSNLSIATYEQDWGTVAAPGQIDVVNHAALSNIAVATGDELIWSFRATSLTTPDADYFMRDQPLTLNFTPAPVADAQTWETYR